MGEHTPNEVSLIPARVDGIDAVSRITIRPTEIEIHSEEASRVFRFSDIGRHQISLISRIVRRLTLQYQPPKMVGERTMDIRLENPVGFIRFYTDPEIDVYLPTDDKRMETKLRINEIIRSGGYSTWDCT